MNARFYLAPWAACALAAGAAIAAVPAPSEIPVNVAAFWGCGDAGDLPIDCFRGDDYVTPTYRPAQPGPSLNRHVRWCKQRYRSYNPATDRWRGRSGKTYRCNSPYDGR